MNTALEPIYAILSTTPERWQRLVGTLPYEVLDRPPAEGEWSALNCLRHLLVAERELYPPRIHNFLAGQNFLDFDPNRRYPEIDSLTPEQLVAEFTRTRQESLALFRQVKDEDLGRILQHPKLGTVTLVQMLHTYAAHDLNHTIQGERALIQHFMLGSGPWRTFFRDHEVGVAKG
ncbi:MAG TPA: DinB family protein [Ktedonobacteraceae bacterium]|nr:DinB family protein [Ktedonobacteraceae bacterium]